ncbi:MAG: pyruvate kinase [Myxococcales bacterium]|nr:pyruvate kinase [Myxococcales bacterium]
MTTLAMLRDAIGGLERGLTEQAGAVEARLGAVAPDYVCSARNFVHYVGLRQHDLRALQLGLLGYGLSSLGRLEGHVLDAVGQVRQRLDDALTAPARAPAIADGPVGPTWDEAQRLLHAHTHALLGPRPPHRHVYVMVTAPSAAEVDAAWVERLLVAGMNLLRVNAAHEDEAAWLHIVTTARAVAATRQVPLRIAVDLPGPKLRTVMLTDGPRVVRWKPTRDELGQVTAPRVVALRPAVIGGAHADALDVPAPLWARLAVGDDLTLRDARGKRRTLRVIEHGERGGRAELRATAYVIPGTRVIARRRDRTRAEFVIADVPARRARLELATAQAFALVAEGVAAPAGLPTIGCTLPAALAALAVGHRVLFDDGHLEAVVTAVGPGHAVLRATYAPGGRFRLGGEKGINLPDTELDLPLCSADDERALAFAARHADLVDASFVRDADDVRELHRRLAALGAARVGVVLKIETTGAFARLPEIVLAALERAPVGVMIARGDLAIESGYQRLAELQEEILWLCEAAHVPVIWATQVLDQLARTGRPSRAEVTDAAMAVRAECVMLNKGPYVAEAAAALDDILRRMEQHQYKKRSLYRRLHLRLPAA